MAKKKPAKQPAKKPAKRKRTTVERVETAPLVETPKPEAVEVPLTPAAEVIHVTDVATPALDCELYHTEVAMPPAVEPPHDDGVGAFFANACRRPWPEMATALAVAIVAVLLLLGIQSCAQGDEIRVDVAGTSGGVMVDIGNVGVDVGWGFGWWRPQPLTPYWYRGPHWLPPPRYPWYVPHHKPAPSHGPKHGGPRR